MTYRGHKIECTSGVWIYSDTGSEVAKDKNRKCGYCNKDNRIDGHDACLGELPEIMNACCGHSSIGECYIQYWDGSCIRGEEALKVIHTHYKRAVWGVK